MSRYLEKIFNECIERLRQGDSIENCLLSYPEVAVELEALLRTALNVNWRASMAQPRPEFKARARAQFISAQYAAAQAKQAKPHPTFFSLQRAWVPSLAMVLILVFSSVGTAAAASNAMPDEPLYPVKLATEQVRLTFAISDEAKAELNVHLVETRSQEIVAMATQGKPEQVAKTTERLVQHLEAAELAINKVEETKTKQAPPPPRATTIMPPQLVPAQPAPPAPFTVPDTKDATGKSGGQIATSQASIEVAKLRQSLTTSINKNLAALESAKDKAPEKAKESLQKAIETTKTKQTQIQQQTSTGTQNKTGINLPLSPGTVHPLPPDSIPKDRGIPGVKINPPPPLKGGSGNIGDGIKPPPATGSTTDKR